MCASARNGVEGQIAYHLENEYMNGAKTIEKVAKCPQCGAPHAFSETRFPAVNDHGYWRVPCRDCDCEFVIPLKNPLESGASFYVNLRSKTEFAGDPGDVAKDILTYDLGDRGVKHRFDYELTPLYLCAVCGESLESKAKTAITADFALITAAYTSLLNLALAGQTSDCRHLVVEVPFANCQCGAVHRATFYVPFAWNEKLQQCVDHYLLAGVTGSYLPGRLEGLFSKTDIMAFLEKLFIRWHLTADRVVVATPFVGHQYLSKEDKLSLWTWLLSSLDPEVAVFVSRKATFSGYKQVLEDVEGLKFQLLESYGLANRLITADTRKQDFHAKFYIGIGAASAEVLSGSANLVKGPSIENISFRFMNSDECAKRYLDHLRVELPPARERLPVLKIAKVNGVYESSEVHDFALTF